MLYNRCKGIYNFGNNTYPRRIRRRSNLVHIFRGKKCVLWAVKYGNLIENFTVNTDIIYDRVILNYLAHADKTRLHFSPAESGSYVFHYQSLIEQCKM